MMMGFVQKGCAWDPFCFTGLLLYHENHIEMKIKSCLEPPQIRNRPIIPFHVFDQNSANERIQRYSYLPYLIVFSLLNTALH